LSALTTVLAPVAWGTTYVTVTELLPASRPLFVAAARVAPAGVVLVLLGALTSRWRPRGSEWLRTALLAMANFGVFFPLLVVGVYRLPGGVAAAVGGLQPLLVAALSWPIAGQRPRPRGLATGVAAAVGVGLVVLQPGAQVDPVGVLAAVGANVSFAVGVVLTKRFPAPPHQRLAATGWQLLLSGVVLVPLALVTEGRPPVPTATNVVGFAYLSLIGTALAFVLWFDGIRRLPTAAPPLLGLAAPITGATIGWVLLDQSLSPSQLAGFVLTVIAITYGTTLRSHAVSAGSTDRPRLRRARPQQHDAIGFSARSLPSLAQVEALVPRSEGADQLECKEAWIRTDRSRERCRRSPPSGAPRSGSVGLRHLSAEYAGRASDPNRQTRSRNDEDIAAPTGASAAIGDVRYRLARAWRHLGAVRRRDELHDRRTGVTRRPHASRQPERASVSRGDVNVALVQPLRPGRSMG
jgi:probable blue pigment (indigoidine) exporter